MTADWTALATYLRGKPDTVALTWRELEDIVGGMPQSAIDHFSVVGWRPAAHARVEVSWVRCCRQAAGDLCDVRADCY